MFGSSISKKREGEIAEKARLIRISIIEMLIEAESGHTAGPLDMADVFASLYMEVLNHKPKDPTWDERDRVILSNGHICPVLYATMAHTGYFPVEELLSLRKLGSRLQGHPHREFLPGLETSSGPLGSGLSQALGMCLAERINNPKSDKKFFCFTGDGELDCGQIWEALFQAGREKLNNLIVIVDRNGIQIDGPTSEVMPLEPLREKFSAFNWNTQVIDGHNISAIIHALNTAKQTKKGPTAIIANTISSKGVPEFERDYRWHGAPPGKGPEDKVPREKQGEVALERLRQKK